jgi:DNA mismatch repair protein MSH5
MIADQEIEIVQDLLEQVLVLEQTIGQACDACAELDCLLSFTEAAQIHNYKRPSMVEGKVVNIVQGR